MNRFIGMAVLLLAGVGAGGWLYSQSGRQETLLTDGEAIAMVKKVRVPQLTGLQIEGKAHFEKNCAACHGTNAAGRQGTAPPLVHKIYEPNHHADFAFYMAASRGVRAHHWPFGDVPKIEDVSKSEVGKIIEYVRALQRANGIH